jgi:predicted nucleotidyltransferase
MLQDRIRETVYFFDLQGIPLTAFEVYKYLLVDADGLRLRLDQSFELQELGEAISSVGLDTVLFTLDDLVEKRYLERRAGFYCLPGKTQLIVTRLQQYSKGLKRERRIKRVQKYLRVIPFVRSIAINGSQSFGQSQANSDIDLFIVTDQKFMWTARTLVTGFFQLFGMRRHGKKIANRFCLNHYVAGQKQIHSGRNLYSALEYLKLRPLVSASVIIDFQQQNLDWISRIFPNAPRVIQGSLPEQSPLLLQVWLEKLYEGLFGKIWESILADWQMRRIRQEKYIVVAADELSFHPQSKAEMLLQQFFQIKTT